MRRPVKNRIAAKPDFKYNSPLVGRFINNLMLDGKKSVAAKIVYDAFDYIKKETKEDPLEVFQKAIDAIGPTMEVRSRRVGGANYQVPIETRPERKLALAIRWILEAARKKSGAPMYKILGNELIAATKGEGEAFKRKENTHRMAEANKAFAHFAFVGKKKKKTAL